VSAGAGGATTQVQYNSSGALAGSSSFVWDSTNTRLGVGTASPTVTVDIVGSLKATTSSQYVPSFVNSTNRAFVVSRSSTASSLVGFVIQNSVSTTSDVTCGLYLDDNLGELKLLNSFATNPYITFSTGGTERARIDNTGKFSVGSAVGGYLSVNGSVNADFVSRIYNGDTSPKGVLLYFSAAAPNNAGTTNNFITGQDNAAMRWYFSGNGGLNNFSANNTNLSDVREKKNIALAGNYLDKINAIPVKTFLYNDQTDNDLNLGVIAQDVQAVAPELVTESDWGTDENPKMRLSVYQTDLQYALMKAIQELSEKLDAANTRISLLEAK
jgi:hypothetical protein